jgi:hypothetical protein
VADWFAGESDADDLRRIMSTGIHFPMHAFEAGVAADPEVLGAFYSGSQGRGTMDRYSDLDLHVWVADTAPTVDGRKIAALLALLGEVKFRSPLRPTTAVTAFVGPDWQRVDLDLLKREELTPWPGYAGGRIIKDTEGVLPRLISEAPARPVLPAPEAAADFIAGQVDSQIFMALQNARGAVWSAMGEASFQVAELYTFLARLRGVDSYGLRYVKKLLTPEEQGLLRAAWPARPEASEVRRAARALWDWARYVWGEAERVLGTGFPIELDEEAFLAAVARIYDE